MIVIKVSVDLSTLTDKDLKQFKDELDKELSIREIDSLVSKVKKKCDKIIERKSKDEVAPLSPLWTMKVR